MDGGAASPKVGASRRRGCDGGRWDSRRSRIDGWPYPMRLRVVLAPTVGVERRRRPRGRWPLEGPGSGGGEPGLSAWQRLHAEVSWEMRESSRRVRACPPRSLRDRREVQCGGVAREHGLPWRGHPGPGFRAPLRPRGSDRCWRLVRVVKMAREQLNGRPQPDGRRGRGTLLWR